MRLTKDVYLLASGACGFSLTNDLDCNVYLIDCHDGCIMVDAGVNIQPELIVGQLTEDGFTPRDIKYIAVTHAHADHSSGAAYFKKITGADILATEHEARRLMDQKLLDKLMVGSIKSGFYPQGYRHVGCQIDRIVKDGEYVELGDARFRVLVLPGHTAGGMCLYGELGGKNLLFTGDTIAYGGLINLLCVDDVDLLGYQESIERLSTLDVDSLFPGHLQPVINRGGLQIEKALRVFEKAAVPRNIF